ncbi:MAG TPA: TRAP transporter large permease subunit [Bacteroidetes bacterium]|nr:TRAP transporter large permease subunit [Bacteroidota bacterium]
MPGYNIFSTGWLIFGVMTATFILLSFIRRQPIGVSLMIGAILGGLVSGSGIPVRHLVEGAFTYFDPMMIIFTAMFFMRVIQENGALQALADLIIRAFAPRPALLAMVVTIFIMFPAMLTGITTTSVLTTGALMAPILMTLGMPRVTTGAMVALISIMGMMAPPINLLAMLIGQGVDMPYIGFEGPLAFIAFPLAFFVAFTLGYPYLKRADLQTLPPQKTKGKHAVPWTLFIPLLVVFILMTAVRTLPGVVPDIGIPLIFVIGGITGLFFGEKVYPAKAAYRALLTGLPVLGLLAGIGMFLQVMTLTGVRGLLVVTVLSLPIALTYLGLLISLPVFGGVSAFASAMVFGIPFLLALLGRNEIVLCSGIALLAGLGDVMLPSAIEARFASQVAGVDNYLLVVRRCLPFVALFALVALVVIHFADGLSFLVPG